MKMMKFFVGAVAAVGLMGLAACEEEASYPTQDIEFVIPFGAGGGADLEGRLLAKEMEKVLGVNMIPVNKVGGGGARTYTDMVNSEPDGYKVAWNSTSVLTTTNLGNTTFDYDAMDHVGRVEFQPQPFVVLSESKWNTFQEFVEDCKANPNTYKVANSGTGSATHVAAIALMDAVGCKVVHLPKGIKGRNKSVLNKEADAMVAPLTGALRLSKAGKFRILVIPSAERNAVISDVPTAKELGYDVVVDLFRGLSVPPGTPEEIKAKLADAMKQAANSEAFKKLAAEKGFTVAPMDHKEFSAYLAQENQKIKGVLQSAGLYKAKSN